MNCVNNVVRVPTSKYSTLKQSIHQLNSMHFIYKMYTTSYGKVSKLLIPATKIETQRTTTVFLRVSNLFLYLTCLPRETKFRFY